MTPLRILFMGASRLVGLLERFNEAAAKLGVSLEMWSIENAEPWHAIGAAGLAKAIEGPPFRDANFDDWLIDLVKKNGIDIAIPNVDPATIALARSSDRLEGLGVLPVVSSLRVCETMADKFRANFLFQELGLRIPDGENFPLLAKPRFGSSSRGQAKFLDREELQFWKARNRAEDFLIQPFIQGQEYSVDAYIDSEGRTLGVVSRVREVVSGGEAMITYTRHQNEALAMADRLLKWDRWFGPINIQVIDDGKQAWLIECNPRFGNGAICSIEAGLAMPEWILRERLNLPLPSQRLEWRDGLCLTRSKKDHFVQLA